MIILGIDPGYAIVGFGVLKAERGDPVYIRHGAINTPAGELMERRLRIIYEDMTELIQTFKPEQMAIEELFFGNNVTTGIAVAQARGVILLTASQAGIPVFAYKPLQVKAAITGYGKAEKKQVMEMTKTQLGLKKIPRPDDAADALAIGICHIRTSINLLSGLK